MFGFGKKEENEEKKDNINWGVVESRLGNSFGLADVDRVLKLYAPKLTGELTNILDNTVQLGGNQINILKEVLSAIGELKEQNERAQRENRELREKYDELVQRMAGYIEKENGKGR